MITKDRAIEIAERSIVGKARRQEGSPITVELNDGAYIVTFVHQNPPGVKGADYDARVTVDAKTGDVKEILVGP
jgi:hypothetical protein